MSLRKFFKQTLAAGVPLPGVAYTVYVGGTSQLTLASLFQDAAGATPLPNPGTNDATFGSIEFYTEEGLYDLKLVKAGFNFPTSSGAPGGTVTNLVIGAPQFFPVRETVVILNGVAVVPTIGTLIPAGAENVHVYVHNDVALSADQGLVSYSVGDLTTTDRWGSGHPLSLNYQSTGAPPHGFSVAPGQGMFATASKVYLYAEGGLFSSTGNGQVTVEVKYTLAGP